MNTSLINIDTIKNFILSKDWSIKEETQNYYLFSPANYPDYELKVYKQLTQRYLDVLLDALEDNFEIEKKELINILQGYKIYKTRIEGTDVKRGKIPLEKFKSLVSYNEQLFKDVANFALSRNIFYKGDSEVSKTYIKNVNFLTTEEGSYILRFELPKDDLPLALISINENITNAEEINKEFYRQLQFFTDITYIQNLSLQNYLERPNFSFNIAKTFLNIYRNAGIVDFSLKASTEDFYRRVKKSEVYNDLKNFVDVLDNYIKQELEEEFKGFVISLNSENPQTQDVNKVVLEGEFTSNREPAKVELKVSRYDYLRLLDAHANHKEVTVKGKFEQLQRKYKGRFIMEIRINEE